jgi:Exocyst complex component Sec10.
MCWVTSWWIPNSILQKHIKRQIISLSGGFQVIADLNTYHTFISSLKVG